MKKRLIELIETLMPDYRLKRISKKNKITLIKKSNNLFKLFDIFNIFSEKKVLNIIEILLIELPLRLSYYRYGNYSYSYYYRTQIINKLENEHGVISEKTTSFIINSLFKEMINTDLCSDEFYLKYMSKNNRCFNGKIEKLKYDFEDGCENVIEIKVRRFNLKDIFNEAITKRATLFLIILLLSIEILC